MPDDILAGASDAVPTTPAPKADAKAPAPDEPISIKIDTPAPAAEDEAAPAPKEEEPEKQEEQQPEKPKPKADDKKDKKKDPMVELAEELQEKFVKEVNQAITSTLEAPVKKAWDAVKDSKPVQDFMQKVEDKKVDAANMTKEFMTAVQDGMKDVLKSGASGLADGMKAIGDKVSSFFSKSSDVKMEAPSDSAGKDAPANDASMKVAASIPAQEDKAEVASAPKPEPSPSDDDTHTMTI